MSSIPVSVIIPTRNEERNLPVCLASLERFRDVWIVDSGSTDATKHIAERHGAKVVQFEYKGGWPKKRQWAMDTLPLEHGWILLLDADEVLSPELVEEIAAVVARGDRDGYYVALQMFFLGRPLRYGDNRLWKLSLFRRGAGRFECRLRDQDTSMADIEIHEHVIVRGTTGKLAAPIIHHNYNSLSRYILKHNEYSNWEAQVLLQPGSNEEIKASLFGGQSARRRWLKKRFFRLPGSPLLLFGYKYFLRLGFLDGVPGLIYCALQGVQMFHTKAKIFELHARQRLRRPGH